MQCDGTASWYYQHAGDRYVGDSAHDVCGDGGSDSKVGLYFPAARDQRKFRHGTEVTNSSAAPYDLSGVFPTGIGSNQVQQRPGLALFNASSGKANIYVSFGSFCDVSPYSGYVAGLTYNYSKQTFAPVTKKNWVFDTEGGSTTDNGGLWMGGAAPAIDESGNLYVAVANGEWNGTTEFGESVVKIASTSSGLFAVDYYTPNDYADLNNDATTTTVCSAYGPDRCPATNWLTFAAPTGDFDLGAAGVTLISPAGVASPVCGSNSELLAGGKEGVVYGICHSTKSSSKLETVMGGLDGCGYNCTTNSNPSLTACTESSTGGAGAIAQCFQGVNAGEDQANGSNDIFNSSGIRGTQLFWAGTASAPENYLYVAGANAALEAYQADTTTGMFNIVGDPAQTPRVYPYPGTVPSLSWDGSSPDTALLWAIDSGGFGLWRSQDQVSEAAKPAILIVYNPLPSGKKNAILQELWESSTSTDDAGPGAVKFTVPTVAGGLVFVPGGTPGYAPGLPGGKNVNCTAAALANSTTPTTCGGMLAVYGKIHN